ncbi:MAG TPA: PPC domain-containing protein [Aggregatilineales bacterium]|nr:PPC domain-containing protein [Aggregatilineales bacterium]
MRLRLFIIGILLVALAISFPLLSAAQGTAEVQIGQPIAGRLTPDQLEIRYAYEGQVGEQLSIAVEATFDSYVELQDDTWQRLASNDDAAEGSGSVLDLTLTRSGLMYIYITSYSGLSTGDYTLRVSSPALQVDDVSSIVYGQTIEDELDSEVDSVPFAFEGSTGDEIRITLNSSEFDAFLTLETLDGEQLANDDNSAGESDAQIDFILPEDGTYVIQVLDAFGGESGAFSLTLNQLENGVVIDAPAPTAAPVIEVPSTGEDIALGSSVEGQLDGTALSYRFEGSADQAILIVLTSDDFDPFLTLLDSSGTVLETDDDSAGNLNALIEFTLPADDTYTIEVGSFFDGARGAYNLSLSDAAVEVVPTPEPNSDGQIALGETVEGELTRRQGTLEYTFEGEAGQVITISQHSDDFDSFVRLLGPDGEELISDDDSGDGFDSLISAYALPENGTYTISAESLGGGGSGSFTLTLDSVDLESIAFGDSIDGRLSREGERLLYSFEGEAGDVVIISLSSEDFDTYLTLNESGGDFPLAENDDTNGTDSLVGPITLPNDGLYQIEVRAYNDGAIGRFLLNLSRPEVVELESGQEADGALTDDTSALVYKINGQAGTRMELRLSGEGDVTFALRGPDGYSVFSQSAFLANSPPFETSTVLNQTGEYLLVVQPTTAGDEVEFSVRLTSRELESLDEEPQIASFSDTVFEAAYQFTGEADQQYELVLEPQDTKGISVNPSIDITQNSTSVAYISTSGVDTVSLTFTVPADGMVVLKITSYAYEDVDVEVTLRPVD